MVYYKWIGKFRRGTEGKIITLKMSMPSKRYAYLNIDETIRKWIERGWAYVEGDLYRTDRNYRVI